MVLGWRDALWRESVCDDEPELTRQRVRHTTTGRLGVVDDRATWADERSVKLDDGNVEVTSNSHLCLLLLPPLLLPLQYMPTRPHASVWSHASQLVNADDLEHVPTPSMGVVLLGVDSAGGKALLRHLLTEREARLHTHGMYTAVLAVAGLSGAVHHPSRHILQLTPAHCYFPLLHYS